MDAVRSSTMRMTGRIAVRWVDRKTHQMRCQRDKKRCRRHAPLFNDESVAQFRGIEDGARRKLEILNAAINLNDLRSPPGNRLEALKGDRKGQHSIRINNQWRICFVWKDGNADDVEIVDYH